MRSDYAEPDIPYYESPLPYESPVATPSSPSAATGGAQYFSDPYVNPSGGVSGLASHPASSILTTDTGRTFGNYMTSLPPQARGYGRSPSGAGISYIGPSVSARPAFNVKLKGKRLRDLLFNRQGIL